MIRQRSPDVALARSLVQASQAEMSFLETLKPTEEAASTIIRGIYENFRRLGEALLILEGVESDHEAEINKLTTLPVKTTRSILVLDNLRRLRHDINYKGYQPSLADLEDVILIKSACWTAVLEEVKKQVF
ncbi:hypothetical protein COV18_07420 [Candidatus Woesearchaeota archaeon CG10_big_fil_rev_8_21_14_0_10_37_12]|nr:MAG: hypothetical protein COV18_07420 [Candidatus Woesearchaeota archaeon CG10_big_fil_rev_8_21_14_0_10_37_12]